MTKRLILRSEHLTELSTAELDLVVGGGSEKLTCLDLPPTVPALHTCLTPPTCAR